MATTLRTGGPEGLESLEPRLLLAAVTVARTDYVVRTSPSDVLALDIDGDGRRDLVSANSGRDEGLSIQLNRGNGRFGRRRDQFLDVSPMTLAGADFDRDGHGDLAIIEPFRRRVVVVMGRSTGLFNRRNEYGVGGEARDLVIGDFDLDGRRDIAVACANGVLTILYGRRGGIFGGRRDFVFVQDVQKIVAGDFNRDGRLDLAGTRGGSGGSGGRVSVILAVGENFAPPQDSQVGLGAYGITTGRFDGDRHLDLAISLQGEPNVTILYGNSQGRFNVRSDFMVPTSRPSAVGEIRAADFDRDGDTDLVVAGTSRNKITLLFNNGAGRFTTTQQLDVRRGPYALDVRDVDADGRPDTLVAHTGESVTTVLLTEPPDQAGNTLAAARDLGALADRLEVADFVSPADRVDYYRFQVAGPSNFRLTVTDLSGDVDVQLRQPGVGVLAESRRDGASTERLRGTLEAGEYFVRIRSVGAARTDYRLILTRTDAAGPVVTAVGPIDTLGDSRATAPNLGFFSGVAVFDEFVGVADRNDYVRVRLAQTGTVNLTLDRLTGDASLRLLNRQGVQLAASTRDGRRAENIRRVLAPGVYYARVTSVPGENANYRLTLRA